MSRNYNDDGALSHVYLDTNFAEIESNLIDTLELGNGLYEVKFPGVKPQNTGLSLVIDSITDSLVEFKWDIGSAGTSALVSNSDNIAFLKAPLNLTNSYNLFFPQYSHSTNVANSILTATVDDGAGNVTLSFVPASTLSDPKMTSNNANTITFNAPNTLVNNVIYTWPQYANNSAQQFVNKVLFVANDDASGNLTLGFTDPNELGNPKLKQGIFTMELAAGNGLARDCVLRFPNYDTSVFTNHYLKVFEDNGAGSIRIDYDPNLQTDTLKIGNNTFTFQMRAHATPLTADVITFPPPNLHSFGASIDAAYSALYKDKSIQITSWKTPGPS